MSKGKFIVIEGVDGAGKTTQIRLLAENLKRAGEDVFVTSEPTCKATGHAPTAVGALISDVLLGKVFMTPSAMASLFLCDRVLHNTDAGFGIKKLLDAGVTVICDRYYYSSCAYQGLESDLDWVISQNINCPDIVRPDICVFLDLDPDLCAARREARGEAVEIFERPEANTSSVREKFFCVFEKLKDDNIVCISADGTKEEVARRVLLAVRSEQ